MQLSFCLCRLIWNTAGGKLTLLSLAEGTPFNAGAVAHPAMIAPEDGEKLSVPLGFYPSHVS